MSAVAPSPAKTRAEDSPPNEQPAAAASPTADEVVAPRVILKFLLHTAAMFTLPFAAFFGARHLALAEFGASDMEGYVWGTVAAVLAVNAVICSYIYQALKEEAAKKHPLKKD